MRHRTFVLAGLFGLLVTSVAQAANFDDVATDLSNDNLNPTPLTLDIGSNVNVITGRTGTQNGLDRDFFRVTVAPGTRLTAVNLTAFDGTTSFVAIQQGNSVTNLGAAAALAGYVHVNSGMLGTNILDDIGLGAGAIGFTGPLGPGNYTFWVQETSTPVVNYTLSLVVAPSAPALPFGAGIVLAGALVGVGALAIGRSARRAAALR